MTCFIIDDDMDDREMFEIAVQGLNKGVEVHSATDCSAALSRLKADSSFVPDFIFLDLNMPGMNGKECLPEIKKLAWLSNVPIIIYTTSSTHKDRRDTLDLGATDFLTKVPTITQLRTSLTSLFEKHGG
jgi:DNA-binding response OmpR family regulator